MHIAVLLLTLLSLLPFVPAGALAEELPPEQEAARRKICQEAQAACLHFSHEPTAATSIRLNMLYWQAHQLPPGQLVFLGDSLTEGLLVFPAGGLQPFNAGVMGANVNWWLDNIRAVMGLAKPGHVLVALGVNDAHAARDEAALEAFVAEWRGKYATLLDEIQAVGAVPVVATVLPLAQTEHARDVAAKNGMVARFNAVLRDVAAGRGLSLVDCAAAMAPEGSLDPALTMVDGVHLSREGYARWRGCLQEGLRAHFDAVAGPPR